MKKLRVAVLMGGPGSEREVSLASGKNVFKAISSGDNIYRYIGILIDVRNPKKVLSQLEETKPNVIFPVVHGTFGEDGTLQALLDIFGKPYVGSGVLASALCMDKVLSSELMANHGLDVPVVLAPRSSAIWRSVVVKPRASGSSVGVSIVKKKSDLAKAIGLASKEGEVMIQEFVAGRELACGVLEFEKDKPFALPVTEIIPKSKFFDYKSKYVNGGSEEITPARISSSLTNQIQTAALLAHKILACRHISRSDFILSKTSIYYLETNTCPGMTDTSLFPQAALAAGYPMPELVHRLIECAIDFLTEV